MDAPTVIRALEALWQGMEAAYHGAQPADRTVGLVGHYVIEMRDTARDGQRLARGRKDLTPFRLCMAYIEIHAMRYLEAVADADATPHLQGLADQIASIVKDLPAYGAPMYHAPAVVS